MTTEVGLFDAKTRLSELVERASGGEAILITKRGKPVARLLPLDTPSAIEEALGKLAIARASSSSGPGTLRELIDEGRRT